MRKNFFISVILFFTVCPHLLSQEIWMFGPMLHINFGGEKVRPSFGFELSYWNYKGVPYSLDGGFEFEKKKFRIYTEAQTGLGLIGASAGPVLQFNSEEHAIQGGFQGSLWANYFWGFDLRFRIAGNNFYVSPGTYAKLPLGYSGDEEENISFHHHHDWD
jgi:hypothetical protein